MKRIIGIAACVLMTAALSQSYAQKHYSHEKGKKQTSEQNFHRHQSPGSHRSFHSKEDMVERRAERLKHQLDLSEKQYKSVVDAGREQMEKAKKLNKDSYRKMEKFSDKQKAAFRKDFKEVRSDYDAKMKEILNDGQWKKYRELNNHRRTQ